MNGNKGASNKNVKSNVNSKGANVGVANKPKTKVNGRMVGFGLASVAIVVIIVFAIVSAISNRSEEPDHLFERKAGDYYLASVDGEDYYVSDAVEKAMVAVKWEHDLGTEIVTVSGKDRKTKDKIVFTMKFTGYSTFESMTRNGVEQSYNEWYEYLMSY